MDIQKTQHDIQGDVWSDWLLCHRHAGDPAYQRIVRAKTERYADRVLDAAQLTSGMTLVDIGSGDGLIAFRAIERIGPSLRVIITDISTPMLQHAERLSIEKGVREQCTFLHCGAEELREIDDVSVDVVTSRAALAYVSNKEAAVREFHRILKHGGRISFAEPILQDEAIAVCTLKAHIDSQSVEDRNRFIVLMHRLKSAQFPDTRDGILNSPITNYTERDLINIVQHVCFSNIHLEYHIDITPTTITSWEIFLGCSPHPWAPAPRVVLEEQFTAEERAFFEQTLRPAFEADGSARTDIDRIAYLTAKK